MNKAKQKILDGISLIAIIKELQSRKLMEHSVKELDQFTTVELQNETFLRPQTKLDGDSMGGDVHCDEIYRKFKEMKKNHIIKSNVTLSKDEAHIIAWNMVSLRNCLDSDYKIDNELAILNFVICRYNMSTQYNRLEQPYTLPVYTLIELNSTYGPCN